jgi:Na+/H+ antiporter NhaD/arsenite permease-like protein
VLGIGALLFVPVFKTITHLPPYMGILFGLGVLWVTTEIMHRSKNEEDKHPLSVVGVLRRVDTTSVLFFLGILLAVSSLATAGHLTQVATALKDSLGNVYAINIAIGLLSSVVDNVPLVAGAMKMYPLVTAEAVAAAGADSAWLSNFVVNGKFWELLAYCAGTGGSCLIIGSAAGVAAMGMERINFIWYLKKISGLALLGYLAGAATYIGMFAFA